MPSDSTLSRTPPSVTVSSEKRLGKPRLPKPQIQPARLFSRMKSPSVTITSVSTSPPSKCRISTALDDHAGDEREPERGERRRAPSGTPPSYSPQATNVLNMAISPWAKFTMPVERKISTSASASAA